MSDAKKIKSFGYSALITDTLPYELPLFISNDTFVDKLEEIRGTKIWSCLENKVKKYSVPFNFKIIKDEDSFRTLSLLHPCAQIEFSEFYNDYKYLMLEYCNKSEQSLRYPDKVASFYYEKDSILEEGPLKSSVEISSGGFMSSQEVASSFFSYRKYNFIYKFYESYEFHRYERQFKKLLRMDVSKCFHNIYTHSIAWAVRDKEFAKKYTAFNPPPTFDSLFDKLMQKSNYNETNGIVVGPEVSRVFAEIIMQRIDCDISCKMDKAGFVRGEDYVFRRYIDDFFFFYNSDKCESYGRKTIYESLESYKLYVNDKKTIVMSRPFATPESISKSEVRRLIDNFLSSLLDMNILRGSYSSSENVDDVVFKKILRVGGASNSFVRDFKAIVKSNGGRYEVVVNYSISRFVKCLREVDKIGSLVKKAGGKSNIEKFLRVVVESVFFIYSMSPRVRATYLLGQFILLVLSIADKLDYSIKDNISKALFDELVMSIRMDSMKINGYPSVESLNLLIIIKSLGKKYLLPEDLLARIFSISLNGDTSSKWEGDYFHICTLINYVGNGCQYGKIRGFLSSHVVDCFEVGKVDLTYAWQTYLLFDVLYCPFFSESIKKKILESVFKSCEPLGDNQNSTKREMRVSQQAAEDIKKLSGGGCFFSWNSRVSLADLDYALHKKELRAAY